MTNASTPTDNARTPTDDRANAWAESYPGDAEPVIEADDVAKIFASGDGVSRLNLRIPPGVIFGFIGPSGSGKTTAVRMLTGALHPTGGKLRVLGRNPAKFGTDTRSRLGYMPQLSVLYPEMTVGGNLKFFSSLYGLRGRTGKKRRTQALEFVDLVEHAGKRADQISGGMQRRLSLATALAHEPELVFLDEPTAGIDPVLRRRLWDHFGSLRDSGRTMFITTQYVGEAAYCDLVGLISDGELLYVDTPTALRRRAVGGEVVLIDLAEPFDRAAVERALNQSAVSFQWLGKSRIEVVVESAGSSIPRIAAELNDIGVTADHIEESVPMFDDVFVTLVERHRAETAVSE